MKKMGGKNEAAIGPTLSRQDENKQKDKNLLTTHN